MVPRFTRPWMLTAALVVLMGVSAGDAFGWGRSYNPCYQSSGYSYYYYPATAYYYPATAPASVSAVAPSTGQPYVAMKPVIEAPSGPAIVPSPVLQYSAPAASGGYYGGYGGSNLPRTSWDLGKFPSY